MAGGWEGVYFRWRGLGAQKAELSTHNTEFGAPNAELRCAVLGGSGRRHLFMPMAFSKKC